MEHNLMTTIQITAANLVRD